MLKPNLARLGVTDHAVVSDPASDLVVVQHCMTFHTEHAWPSFYEFSPTAFNNY